MAFCDPIRKYLMKEQPAKVYTVCGIEGDDCDLECYNDVLEWIRECVDNMKCTNFRTVRFLSPHKLSFRLQ